MEGLSERLNVRRSERQEGYPARNFSAFRGSNCLPGKPRIEGPSRVYLAPPTRPFYASVYDHYGFTGPAWHSFLPALFIVAQRLSLRPRGGAWWSVLLGSGGGHRTPGWLDRRQAASRGSFCGLPRSPQRPAFRLCAGAGQQFLGAWRVLLRAYTHSIPLRLGHCARTLMQTRG